MSSAHWFTASALDSMLSFPKVKVIESPLSTFQCTSVRCLAVNHKKTMWLLLLSICSQRLSHNSYRKKFNEHYLLSNEPKMNSIR